MATIVLIIELYLVSCLLAVLYLWGRLDEESWGWGIKRVLLWPIMVIKKIGQNRDKIIDFIILLFLLVVHTLWAPFLIWIERMVRGPQTEARKFHRELNRQLWKDLKGSFKRED